MNKKTKMELYEIRNKNQSKVKISNLGARIISIGIKDKKGKTTNAILTYENMDDYKKDDEYLGSLIGRYANRIENGSFLLGNSLINLSINEREKNNHLHGGNIGFDKRIWKPLEHQESSLELSLVSMHGEEGYPGNLMVNVRYTLLDNDTLRINFKARTDRPTIVNLTNHNYFNLSTNKNTIDNHIIKIESNFYTPLNNRFIPVKPFEKNVSNSKYDLRNFTKVASIKDTICNANYIFPKTQGVRKMATIIDLSSSRKLTISSDYPAMQVYFGNFLKGKFHPFQGLCCEPHYSPNSPNIEGFPSTVLSPSKTYKHTIEYKFENF